MGKADLHIHTAHGDGMAGATELLRYVEHETDLDVIAVTDHDDLKGAALVREEWAKGKYRFEVITGMEVTTIEGHLLALFLERPVRSLRPLIETLHEVHDLGGLCVIPHPLSWLTRSIKGRDMDLVLRSGTNGVHFDGIEIANQSLGGRVGLRKASEINQDRLHLAEVGGSDAHFLQVIGSAHTRFPGRSAEDLKTAILGRTTQAANGSHPTFLDIGLGQIARQSWRGFTVTPRKMGWGPTAASFVKRIFHL